MLTPQQGASSAQVLTSALRSRRKSLGLDQKELAQKIGVSPALISQFETFRSFPAAETAKKIAMALQTEVTDLFPNWLKFYIQDESGQEPESTVKEIQRILEVTSLGRLTDIILPSIDSESDPAFGVEIVGLGLDIRNTLECLVPRERHAITLRFNLDGQGIRTLDQVAELMNITRERVRQIESNALEKIRRAGGSVLRGYLDEKENGQWRQLSLPINMDQKTRHILKVSGIRVLLSDSESKDYQLVEFPEGWSTRLEYSATESSVLYDDKNRPRLRVHRRPPKLESITRFELVVEEDKEHTLVVHIKDAGKIIASTDRVDFSPRRYRWLLDEAEEWLQYRFPAWRNPAAYWD